MLLAALIALAAPQACPTPARLPAVLAAWATPGAASAGASAARAPTVAVGSAVTAALVPMTKLTPAATPGKAPAAGTSGGLLTFTVATPGRYQVALGAGAWVDVISGRTALMSVEHGHGPACTSVRKIVQFDLKPGRYLLQIAGSPVASVPVMVSRAS